MPVGISSSLIIITTYIFYLQCDIVFKNQRLRRFVFVSIALSVAILSMLICVLFRL